MRLKSASNFGGDSSYAPHMAEDDTTTHMGGGVKIMFFWGATLYVTREPTRTRIFDNLSREEPAYLTTYEDVIKLCPYSFLRCPYPANPQFPHRTTWCNLHPQSGKPESTNRKTARPPPRKLSLKTHTDRTPLGSKP